MLRSKAYNIFIIFFFVVSLILSGCRTTRHIRENEEDSQLITVNNQPSADSLQPSADSIQLPADSVQLSADSVQPSADSVQLSAVSQQPIANSQKPKANSQKPKANSQESISGSWLSSEQGASLTIDNYGYRIDFFGVDASAPMTGMIIIEDNKISFISNGRDCKNEEGSYKITFNKKNIRLVCKKDDCTKRRNILEADWEWMEI